MCHDFISKQHIDIVSLSLASNLDIILLFCIHNCALKTKKIFSDFECGMENRNS